MARFEQLNQYINDVVSVIISNQNICKFLSCPVDDPLSIPNIDDTSELLFNCIFPFPKVPDVNTEKSSFLTVYIDNFQLGADGGTKNGLVLFNVIVHNDLWRMDRAMQRPLSILNEIDEMFNGKKTIGAKKVQFDRLRHVYINENYSGYQATYSIVSVN
ncbi:hypothetical protein [Paenibacillus tianjinensis]|uniref:DUF3168 domain-containing protein n=1 Tax=Paenibacillus tianjinensis TaxID=2810347 RepID=A0ABX7L5D1_9BACL|nr:hypothetical protein [Paenibacillus tianjinensis]QSF43272.1 hypothetical protein JRJ22_18570 [Paenibacillus tianjinensis]